MLRKIIIAIHLFLLVAAAGAADDLVVTRASVSPSTALPATAVWFSFEVRNASDHRIAIPLHYVIEITPPTGEPFLARHADNLASAVRTTTDARVQLEAVASTAKHELTRVRARAEARKLKSPDDLKAKFATAAR